MPSGVAENRVNRPGRPSGGCGRPNGPTGRGSGLDFGLEPFESADAAYYGATLAALAVGTAPAYATSHTPDATVGLDRLRGYLKERRAAQSLLNQVALLLASTRLKDVLTSGQQEALIA